MRRHHSPGNHPAVVTAPVQRGEFGTHRALSEFFSSLLIRAWHKRASGLGSQPLDATGRPVDSAYVNPPPKKPVKTRDADGVDLTRGLNYLAKRLGATAAEKGSAGATLQLQRTINKTPQVTGSNARNLTEADAARPGLDFRAFDDYGATLKEDGVLGSKTAGATRAAVSQLGARKFLDLFDADDEVDGGAVSDFSFG